MQLKDYDSFPDKLPILIEDNLFLYPFMIAPIFINDERNIKAIEFAIANNKLLTVAVTKKIADDKSKTFYNIAVVGNIMRKVILPDGRVKILFQGLEKVIIEDVEDGSPVMGTVDVYPILPFNKKEIVTILDILLTNITKLSKLNNKFPIDLIKTIEDSTDPVRIADLISSVIQISNEDAYSLFKEADIAKRLLNLIEFIKKECERYKLKNEINKKVNVKLDKHQKDYILKEQLQTIKKELGYDDARDKEIVSFKKQLKAIKPFIAKDGYKEMTKQINRLSRMHPDSADAGNIQTYIEQVLEIPFGQIENKPCNVQDVEKQLNKDHYA